MLIYMDDTRRILTYNTYLTKEEGRSYTNNTDCFWIDGLTVDYQDYDPTSQAVEMYLNEDSTIRYEVVDLPQVPVEVTLKNVNENITFTKEVAVSTGKVVETTSFDNLINMDMLLGLDEKLNAIMKHLKITL